MYDSYICVQILVSMLGSAKNFTATNALIMGTKRSYTVRYSTPDILDTDNAEMQIILVHMSIEAYMFVVCKQHLECSL